MKNTNCESCVFADEFDTEQPCAFCYDNQNFVARKKEKMPKWYRFEFEDGYVCYCAGLSKLERTVEERKHGKLVRKTKEC